MATVSTPPGPALITFYMLTMECFTNAPPFTRPPLTTYFSSADFFYLLWQLPTLDSWRETHLMNHIVLSLRLHQTGGRSSFEPLFIRGANTGMGVLTSGSNIYAHQTKEAFKASSIVFPVLFLSIESYSKKDMIFKSTCLTGFSNSSTYWTEHTYVAWI